MRLAILYPLYSNTSTIPLDYVVVSHIYDFVRVAVFTWLSLCLGFGGGGGFLWLLLVPPPELKLGGRIGDKDLPLALCSPDLGVEGKVEILGRSLPSLFFDTAVSGRLLAGELAADIFLAFGLDSSSELSSSTLLFIAVALVVTYAMSTLFSSLEAAVLLFSTVSVFIVGIFSTGSSVAAVWCTGIC